MALIIKEEKTTKKILYFLVRIVIIHLKIYHVLNIYLKNMKKSKTVLPKKKQVPVIQSVSNHPNYLRRDNRSYYSFRINKQTLDFKNISSLTNGCHSFVKSLFFNDNKTSLGILTPYKGIPFEIDEISKYIELLSEIGFKIKFEGTKTVEELIKESPLLKKQYTDSINNDQKCCFLLNRLSSDSSIKAQSLEEVNKEVFLFFTLDETYKNNQSKIRYSALCFLRMLFISTEMWFPRMFLTYYNYFKKIKIKPSLHKILIFTYSSPVSHLYSEKAKTEACEILFGSHGADENYLRYGYYTFFGLPEIVNKSTCFSSLLATSNDFNLITYLENYDKILSKSISFTESEKNVLMSYINIDLGRSKYICDNGKIQQIVNELILEGSYHKAYIYLKEKVCQIIEIHQDPFVKVFKNKISYETWSQSGSNRYSEIRLTKEELKKIF